MRYCFWSLHGLGCVRPIHELKQLQLASGSPAMVPVTPCAAQQRMAVSSSLKGISQFECFQVVGNVQVAGEVAAAFRHVALLAMRQVVILSVVKHEVSHA